MNKPYLRCYYTNATSLVNKRQIINLELTKLNNPEVLCFTETWFDSHSVFNIDNYQLFYRSRPDSARGGGVAIYVRQDLIALEIIETSESEIFLSADCEQIWCQIKVGTENILIGCIYRPPPNSKFFKQSTNSSIIKSINKATKLVRERVFTNLLLAGDFNWPLISWSNIGGTLIKPDIASEQFLNCVNSNFLKQAVLEPTFKENQLDLVLTYDPSSIFSVEIGAPLGNTEQNGLHCSLTWNIQLKDHLPQLSAPSRPSYRHGNYLEMNQYFSSIDWHCLFRDQEVNDQYNILMNKYEEACIKFIPKKDTTVYKQKPKWLNKSIKMASKLKHKLFSELRASSAANKPTKRKEFNLACRSIKKLVYKAIIVYEGSIALKGKKNPKLLFS